MNKLNQAEVIQIYRPAKFRTHIFSCIFGFVVALLLVQYFLIFNPVFYEMRDFIQQKNKDMYQSADEVEIMTNDKSDISKAEVKEKASPAKEKENLLNESELSAEFSPRNPFSDPYSNNPKCYEFYSKKKGDKVSVGPFKHVTPSYTPACTISRMLNTVYVHVPRAASSAIRADLTENFPLAEFSGCEMMRLSDSEVNSSINPYSFSFVREPIARAKSAFTEFIRRLPKNYVIDQENVSQHIDTWLEKLEKGLTDRYMWQHLVPQSYLLTAPSIIDKIGYIPFIGQVEALNDHYSLLMRTLGAAAHLPEGGYRCCPSERAKTIENYVLTALRKKTRVLRLCRIYAQDYTCLGYKMPSVCLKD